MDIQIAEGKTESIQIIIHCKQIDDEVDRLKRHIELFDRKIYAKKEGETCFVNLSDVLYFETVDNRTFLYTADDVAEVKYRLYELELMLNGKDFIRISKSLIVNINNIQSMKPELNRTILLTMCNGEHLSISRKYVKSVKQILSI